MTVGTNFCPGPFTIKAQIFKQKQTPKTKNRPNFEAQILNLNPQTLKHFQPRPEPPTASMLPLPTFSTTTHSTSHVRPTSVKYDPRPTPHVHYTCDLSKEIRGNCLYFCYKAFIFSL
ncbi:hypothetical protein V6Z11_A07G058600 [Gossypium hirsutum]